MSEGNGLPRGWVEVPLGECGIWHGGGTPSKANDSFWRNGTVPWISPKDMKALRLTDSEDHISQSAIEETNVKPFPSGTVLIVIRSGILGRTLPVAVADVSATMNQDLKGIHPSPWLDSQYLAHLLRSRAISILRTCSKDGTTVPSIDTSALHAVPIQVPPLPEQHRIVEKIEELFSDLDAGVASLERAKANLKRYRASVLKSAVEGRLTEEWRKEHPQAEDGQMLLDRILRERREKWDRDQLQRFREKGKEPPKNWQSKYEEPSAPDASELPELPKGWAWASLAQVTKQIVDGTHHTPIYVPEGVAFISVKDIHNETINFSECKYISRSSHDELTKRCNPEQGDLLVTKSGTIGRVAVVATDRPFSLFVSVALLKPVHGGLVLPKWMSVSFRAWMRTVNVANDIKGSTIKNLHLEDFRVLPVPLPPLAEQEQIVLLVEERLSQIDSAEKTINQELIRSKRLRQSILKTAFEGKLVPQDPKDEPASVLLERIKASREADPPKKKSKKAKRVRK